MGLVLAFILLGWLPETGHAARFRYRPESNLKFHGVSTIRSWTCDTIPVEGALELPFRVRSRRDLLKRLEGFEPVGSLKIPVDDIDCGESGVFDHNENLYRTLQGSEYPYVVFDPTVLRDITWDTMLHGTIEGDLTLTDETRAVTIPLSVDVTDSRTLRVTGEFTVSLDRYGLTPPQLLLGLISIYDTVRITIDLRLYVEDAGSVLKGSSSDTPSDRSEKGTNPEEADASPGGPETR